MIAPARVNLLGEHTDYTGGLVLPMAIPFQTIVTIRPSRTCSYRFASEVFSEEFSISMQEPLTRRGAWVDYPIGVLAELRAAGVSPPAFELSITGNVPFGAGLSSSASVEIASCLAMLSLMEEEMSAAEIALLCQRAENTFVESPCGIMDQFVIAAARAGHALLLNTRDLTHELIPMEVGGLAGTCIVIVNSSVKHSIADGGYGLRRQQVEAGQAVLRKAYPWLQDLGAATLDQLEECVVQLTREEYLRCRHVISENERVRQAKDLMTSGDASALGVLMLQAHASQRDDFECSCEETNFLVATAAATEGCYGARMTGGGFGGCTVNLVERRAADAFAMCVQRAYMERFNLQAETYVCEAVDGALVRNGIVLEGKGQ